MAGLLVILVAADLFTNGVEWLGRALALSAGAVGGVLAAVGTALPETIVPVVAILLTDDGIGGVTGDEIGVGAILGAPFMLSTVAMCVTGFAVITYRNRRRTGTTIHIDSSALGINVRYFVLAYAIAVGAALVPVDLALLRYAAVAAVLVIYVAYVRRHFRTEVAEADEELAPLRLRALDALVPGRGNADRPRKPTVLVQIVLAGALMIIGAVVFVEAISQVSLGLGLDPVLLALLIAPAATELPETLNSVIWVRNGKDTLALGNITGAMVFQATIPAAIGIVLASASWTLSPENSLAFASAAIAFASTVAIFGAMALRRSLSPIHLLLGGAFYLGYVVLVISQTVGT